MAYPSTDHVTQLDVRTLTSVTTTWLDDYSGQLQTQTHYHQLPSDGAHCTDQCLNLAVHRVSGQYDDPQHSSYTHGGLGHEVLCHRGTQWTDHCGSVSHTAARCRHWGVWILAVRSKSPFRFIISLLIRIRNDICTDKIILQIYTTSSHL